MEEIKFYAIHKRIEDDIKSKVIYYDKEEGITTEPYYQTNFTIMTGGAYVGLDINLDNMQLLAISGSCPKNTCIFELIEPPKNIDSASIIIDTKENWLEGMGTYIQENNTIYYNSKNNWFCIGEKDNNKYDCSVKFMENVILCLENNKFKALWFNPIHK